jgi:hypothetical protein
MHTQFGKFSEYEGYGDYGDFWSTISAPVKKLVSGVGSVVHRVAKEAGRTVIVRAVAKTSIGKELERVGDRVDTQVLRPGMAAVTSGDLLKAFSLLNPVTAVAMTVSDSHISDAIKAIYPLSALSIQDAHLKHVVVGAYVVAAVVAVTIMTAGTSTPVLASAEGTVGAGGVAAAGTGGVTAAGVGTATAGGLTAAQIGAGIGVASGAVGLAKTTGLLPTTAPKERAAAQSGLSPLEEKMLLDQQSSIMNSPYFLPVAVGGGAILILGTIVLAVKK